MAESRVKLLISYDVVPELQQAYYEFVLGEMIPSAQSMGLVLNEAWHTAYGDYPIRLNGFVGAAAGLDRFWPLLNGSSWKKAKRFVNGYHRKIVVYREGFHPDRHVIKMRRATVRVVSRCSFLSKVSSPRSNCVIISAARSLSSARPVSKDCFCEQPHSERTSLSRSPFWKERRVFVTGCTGILGSWLTQAPAGRRRRCGRADTRSRRCPISG
jgi:hypothetical protein